MAKKKPQAKFENYKLEDFNVNLREELMSLMYKELLQFKGEH